MHYLISGHTGFKGAWLSMVLLSRGHEVSGISLDPEPDALFSRVNLAQDLSLDVRGDIRDSALVSRALSEAQPDVVIHMAAQPLVRDSYRRPRWTVETNVLGTLNFLEAVASTPSVRAHVVVTTDKVYENRNVRQGYRESDPLGFADPYSTSKAMADLLTQSWISSFEGPPTAVARAGNVIGGGDVSKDRLMPDVIAAVIAGRPVELRYPDAVRPWQHVLDCLDGYLALVDRLLTGQAAGAWNFGPSNDSWCSVAELVDIADRAWGADSGWTRVEGNQPTEAGLLALDSTKAHEQLAWSCRLDLESAVAATVDWHKRVLDGELPADVTRGQVTQYYASATT